MSDKMTWSKPQMRELLIMQTECDDWCGCHWEKRHHHWQLVCGHCAS